MQSLPPLPEWVKLEHKVAEILTQQEIHGWYFDEQAARELESALRIEYETITKILLDRYPYVAGKEFTPKRNNKSQGYIEGCTFTRLKDFNPSSRDHIAWILQTHCGWTPVSMTSTGKPSNRRDSSQGDWDGYCSEVLDTTGSNEAVRNDIRRRERMAEAMYEV